MPSCWITKNSKYIKERKLVNGGWNTLLSLMDIDKFLYKKNLKTKQSNKLQVPDNNAWYKKIQNTINSLELNQV